MNNDPVCCCDGNGSAVCWLCGGEGGFHDCGEDCCACRYPELNETCDECGGRGFFPCPVHALHEMESDAP